VSEYYLEIEIQFDFVSTKILYCPTQKGSLWLAKCSGAFEVIDKSRIIIKEV